MDVAEEFAVWDALDDLLGELLGVLEAIWSNIANSSHAFLVRFDMPQQDLVLLLKLHLVQLSSLIELLGAI